MISPFACAWLPASVFFKSSSHELIDKLCLLKGETKPRRSESLNTPLLSFSSRLIRRIKNAHRRSAPCLSLISPGLGFNHWSDRSVIYSRWTKIIYKLQTVLLIIINRCLFKKNIYFLYYWYKDGAGLITRESGKKNQGKEKNESDWSDPVTN